MCHCQYTGKSEGAQLCFKLVLQERLQDFIPSNTSFEFDNEVIKVKLSGNGARMTHNTSFMLLSFPLLQSSDDVISARGNHTIAVVKGNETFDTLKD